MTAAQNGFQYLGRAQSPPLSLYYCLNKIFKPKSSAAGCVVEIRPSREHRARVRFALRLFKVTGSVCNVRSKGHSIETKNQVFVVGASMGFVVIVEILLYFLLSKW